MSVHGDVAEGPGWELRCGRWQDVLGDVTCDALVADPPYSERVHSGQRTGSSTRKTTIEYQCWTAEHADELALSWCQRVRWWSVIFSDHTLQREHQDAWGLRDWYTFAPVIWLRQCPTPRMSGDGPTSACDYLTIARPRHRIPAERMGSRPGYYVSPHSNGPAMIADSPHPGGKLVAPMRAVIRDYTRPGDLVCDPCAGGGTTLLAAVMEGRRAIGSEMDPATFDKAVARLRKGYTAPLAFDAQPMKQTTLDMEAR